MQFRVHFSNHRCQLMMTHLCHGMFDSFWLDKKMKAVKFDFAETRRCYSSASFSSARGPRTRTTRINPHKPTLFVSWDALTSIFTLRKRQNRHKDGLRNFFEHVRLVFTWEDHQTCKPVAENQNSCTQNRTRIYGVSDYLF